MVNVVFGLFGGLGLFIFGMKYLSEGLQKTAGTKIRRILRSLTQSRIRGVMLGAGVTSIIQSSSVTTVILVGLINAGIISLMQASSVVIGANIGTTITAQIIAFKISKYALPAIGFGVLMMIVARKRKVQFWGQVIFSFGLIFLGLHTMSGVMKPLKDVPAVTDFFVKLSSSPVLAVMLGVLFTVLIQSSSASIGMVLALATVGLIDFRASLFLVLGDNIGTTVTAWLASIGGSTSAKRMACFHSFFNIIGVIYFVFLVQLGIFPRIVDMITPGEINTDTIARHIANAHSLFNVFNGVIFLFLMGPVVKLAEKVIPGKDIYVNTDFKYLQDKLLDTPEIAIESAKRELLAMGKIVRETTKTAIDGFFAKDKKSIAHVLTQESATDNLQHDLTFYLAKLSTKGLTPDLGSQLPPLIHSINDFERIADHSVNLSELTEKIYAENLVFSNKALSEMRTMYAKLDDIFIETMRVIEFQDKVSADRVAFYEKEVNLMQRDYLKQHADRLCKRSCDPHSALIFVDFINNLEKIADHLTNISQASIKDFHFNGAVSDKVLSPGERMTF